MIPSAVSPPPINEVSAIVIATSSGDGYLAPRTIRALKQMGLDPCDLAGEQTNQALIDVLRVATRPVWIIRAGSWPIKCVPPHLPAPSVTGRALCALGAVRVPLCADTNTDHAYADAVGKMAYEASWANCLQCSGGHLDAHLLDGPQPPPLISAYLEPALFFTLAEQLAAYPFCEALSKTLRIARPRVVRWPAFDVGHDSRLRVAEVITSLQRGGAERVVIDLAATLASHLVATTVITTGRPSRAAFVSPAGTIDLSRAPGDRAGRMQAAAKAALGAHVDLVHAHLLDAADLVAFREADLPVMLSVHNMANGWQAGMSGLKSGEVTLLAACSQQVEQELVTAGIELPIRTVWNGIDFGKLKRTPSTEKAALDFRQAWGFKPDALVMLALANPRPQKRLHRLPAILARIRQCLPEREVCLVIAGENDRLLPENRAALDQLHAEVDGYQMREYTRFTGAVDEVAGLLHASNLLICVSAWEGLSLAILEALGAGLPVVATDVGGAAETAAQNPAMRLLPLDFSDEQAAQVVVEVFKNSVKSGADAASIHFSRERMAERSAQLMMRAVHAHGAHGRGRKRTGLWLITNNFSTGGAQSSARRLLIGLASRGHRVRAAVVQEQQAFPTPGRQALQEAGISVLTLPTLGTRDAALVVAQLLEAIDHDPPDALVVWNLVPQYKILIADLLLDIPIFDVSPGEMNFASLEKYFSTPRAGLPYRSPREYGRRLAGAIVKYQGERTKAEQFLGTQVEVVPNGVMISGEMPSRKDKQSMLVMGTSARISPQKKLEELINALRKAHSRLPPYVLRIAGGVETGSEDYLPKLQSLGEGLPIEWVGEKQNIGDFLSTLDLFVMISEPAGCPNASLEAMAAGLPVVATDFGGARDQVIDGETGRLVPRGDIKALASALVEACASRCQLENWGRSGWARARELFSLERMLDDYERVLRLRRT